MGKIIGNTTATPNPRPDWNQPDSTKADYIKNKPDLSLKADLVNGKIPADQLPMGINTDETLTQEGQAADAAACGARFDSLRTLPDVTDADNGKVLGVVGGAWTIINAPSGTGGGSSKITITNKSEWISKTIAEGVDCFITLAWASENSGNGVLKVYVNDVPKITREVRQGDIDPINVGPYLAKGLNEVKMTFSDIYGDSLSITYTITTVSISISSFFNDKTPWTGEIPFSYTPIGAVEKTVYFLIDGNEVGRQTVTRSGHVQTFTIPAQSHGSHTLEVYFVANIDGEYTPSNHLYCDLICYEEGNNTPIITTYFREETVKQHGKANIDYIAYTPNSLTSDVKWMDGDTVVKELTVGREVDTWSYKATEAGIKNLYIVCGETVKPISFNVVENNIPVQAETQNLELYLTSDGKAKTDPLEWSYNGIQAQMTDFNRESDGWQFDDNGNTVLRVAGDARVNIPFYLFGNNNSFRNNGKTIEIEFATRDVINYDAVVLSCWSGERGIKITAQKATLKSAMSEVFTQYKEDEHVRISFVVEKEKENRLIYIYINGIMSGAVQYTGGDTGDKFAQLNPVGISIGSNDCIVDIYNIRVYNNNLTQYQILENWIADTQDVGAMTERYNRNNIFDDYGNVVISKLPKTLPYLVINADSYDALPKVELDAPVMSGRYVDPSHPEWSFTFEDATVMIQGTSSLTYPRKNYKIYYNGGFVVNGVKQDKYQLRPTSIPVSVFTYKADQASSEGANNVELVRFYDDTCPAKTPPQLDDDRVRQGIEGYPILMFYYDGENHHFIGKYNFNHDKENAEILGLEDGDESWEIRQNNTPMAVWKDDNFEGDGWKESFKARYPKGSKNTTNLAELATWLKSTDTTAVDTEEKKAARLEKFKNEFEYWFNKDALIFNYIFTELFLMMDNRAKNAFPTRYDEDEKWLILPYDYDSAIGINNMGELRFGYHLEDIDTVGGEPVFNGQDSVLFVNIRLAFADEIKEMYQNLRSGKYDGAPFTYEEIEKRFEDHQGVWGEAIFNEDSKFKYIEPLTKNGSTAYLPMLQGAKAEQRKWWLYNRFRYLDSKYDAGDSLEDFVKVRPRAVADITVTPYADIYATAKFDTFISKERALREYGSVTLENRLSAGKEADVLIYSASQLSDIGDLSPLKIEWADFSMAKRLSSLRIGSGESGYDNPHLTTLTVGNLNLLKTIDIRNCSALTQPVVLSGCANIEHIYCEGTKITGVSLPNGGILKTMHLPDTVTSLVIRNHPYLTDFEMPSYENVSILRLENVNTSVFDIPKIIREIPENSSVRVLGLNLTFNDYTDVESFYSKLDACKGLDENGGDLDNAVVSGVIHVGKVTNTFLENAKRYPDVIIDYAEVTNAVVFIVNGEVVSKQFLSTGEAIAVPNSPAGQVTPEYIRGFIGWSLDGVSTVTVQTTMGDSDLTYTALFKTEFVTYQIRFLNLDGTVLKSVNYKYGQTPVYDGVPVNPINSTLAFLRWEPAITAVTGNADYTAIYEADVVTRALAKRTIVEYSDESIEYIAQYAFAYCEWLKSINAPSVTRIGNSAFLGCSNLLQVQDGVHYVNDWVVGYDSGVKTVAIRENTRIICDDAFNGSSSLTSVTIPSSDTFMGEEAFRQCKSLTSATINCGNISYYAFANCSSLSSLTIGDSVTSIGDNAFHGCSGLTSITIPDSVTSIGKRAFDNCSGLTSVTIGDGVTSIGEYAFYNCGLTSVTIPDSVTSIGDCVFQGCKNMTSLTICNSATILGNHIISNISVDSVILPAVPPSINNYTFASAPTTCVFYIPTGSLSAYQAAPSWSSLTSKYTFTEEDR